MIKILISNLLLLQMIYAETFSQFLQHAIKNSPELKASSLQVDQAYNKGKLLLRYKNPKLVMETSTFKPISGQSSSGYRVALSQPIRLFGVSNDKQNYAKALVKSTQANTKLLRADFIRDLSLNYLEYIRSHRFLELGKKEIILAKKIFMISTERYKQGTVSRGKLLQAKIDYELAQSKYENLSIIAYEKYIMLLKRAGFNQEIILDPKHIFTLKEQRKRINPQQNLLQLESETSAALASVYNHKIEWINLFSEYESEPEQGILRFSLNLPLAIFNTKKEERTIAKLESKKKIVFTSYVNAKIGLEKKRLKQEYLSLSKLFKHSERILKSEKELLSIYEDSYKIANINLLELQKIKNQVIESQGRLIDIQTRLQSNVIYQNYLQGNYNE